MRKAKAKVERKEIKEIKEIKVAEKMATREGRGKEKVTKTKEKIKVPT